MKLFSILSLVPILISGYPDGAPDDSYRACQTLVPGHGFEPQPEETNPVDFIIDKNFVSKGQGVNIKVRAKENQHFKGFIIQARNAANIKERIGTFTRISNGRTMNCENYPPFTAHPSINNSVTHSKNDLKTSMEATWIWPNDFKGSKVIFMYSIVEQFDTFWSNLQAEVEVKLREEGSRNV